MKLNSFNFVGISLMHLYLSIIIYILQVLSLQKSGIKLGTFKSINESITRVAVYVSLLTLYCLGGNKVKAVSTASL